MPALMYSVTPLYEPDWANCATTVMSPIFGRERLAELSAQS